MTAAEFEDHPDRHPAATAALREALAAMSLGDGELAKLRALRDGAMALEPFDDDGALDRLSDVAIDHHSLGVDIVTSTIAAGREIGRKRLEEPPPGSGKPVVSPKQPRFKLIRFDDLKPGTDPEYLIDGLFPRCGLIVVWGPPKCGKSFWTMDAALHVALGWEYRSRAVERGSVVYCAFEGQSGYGKRAEAFRTRHLPDQAEPIPFYLVAASMNLVADHGELIRSIRLQLGPDAKPAMIVLDTLNRSLVGSESDDKDMAAYVKAADALRAAFTSAVLIVHHCGVDATRPRGHTSLGGAVDAQIAVKRDGADNILVEVEWMKDGPEGDKLACRLVTVDVGTDVKGRPMTSCVVDPASDGISLIQPEKPNGDGWTKALVLFRKSLLTTLVDHGCDLHPYGSEGPQVRAVDREKVRAEFYAAYPAEGDTEAKRSEAKRKAFGRDIAKAQAAELIGVRNIVGETLLWFRQGSAPDSRTRTDTP